MKLPLITQQSVLNVAMMQPGFMPWLGLFELIAKSDVFIFLDDFQFSYQSYNQRNRFFVNKSQVDWYTVPVCKDVSFKASLNKVKINDSTPWRRKMWARIEYNYSKAPYFAQLSEKFRSWLFMPVESLAELNIRFIKLVCELLGYPSNKFCYSSEYPSELKRSERVLELLRWGRADKYLSANGSFSYMLEDGVFPVDEVEVLFQNFEFGEYKQIGSPNKFIPSLSIFDALLNIGPEATGRLVADGTKKWLNWREMLDSTEIQTGKEMKI